MRVNMKKSKAMLVGREKVAPQVKVETNWDIFSSFKYLESCFSKVGGPQDQVKMRVGEGLKALDAMKKTFNMRSVSLGVERKLYERVVAETTSGVQGVNE